MQEFPGCDVESLKRKFHSCHRKKIPTENSNMSEEIRMAKRVKYLIGDRVPIGGNQKSTICLGTPLVVMLVIQIQQQHW